MAASAAVPGLFLCFAATVLLIFVSVSTPTWNAIYFLRVGTGNSEIRYGVFGFTGTPRMIGYEFVGVNDNVNSTVIVNLTKTLILHPIAAGLSGLAFLFGLCGASYHRFGTIFMSLLSGLAAIVTLVAFVLDMALFGVARTRIRNGDFNRGLTGSSAQFGNANWLTLGALVALLIGFCASACGVFGRYRRRRDTY